MAKTSASPHPQSSVAELVDLPAQAAEAAPAQAPRPGRRRLAIVAGIVLGVIALLALLVLVAPRHIARYVADNYFQGLQIDVEGVKTIDVDIPEGRFSLGPVRFYAGESVPATVGQFGVDLSLGKLFSRQALLEAVILSDVDVAIRQTADGEILINGVSLRQFLARESEEKPKPPSEGESKWGAGIDHLEFRNVRVAVTNKDGGTAEIVLNALDLRGFHSWEPDSPGSYILTANANGIPITAAGTARPFADKVTSKGEITIERAGLASVEQYTGPLGFDRSAGSLFANARYEVSLSPKGRIEGAATADIGLDALDLSKPQQGAFKLDKGAVNLDARILIDEEGTTTVTGTATVKLDKGDGSLAQGTGFTLPSVRLDIADLKASRGSDKATSVATDLRLDLQQAGLSGPAQVRTDSLLLALPGLALGLGADGQASVRLEPAADAKEKPRLEVGKAAVTSPVEANIETLRLDLDAVSADVGADGKTAAKTTAMLSAESGTLAIGGGGGGGEGAAPVAMTFDRFATRVAELALTQAGDKMSVSGLAATDLNGLVLLLSEAAAGRAGEPRRIAAEAVNLRVASIDIEKTGGVTRASIGGDGQVQRLSASLPAAGDAPRVDIGSEAVQLGFADMKATAGDDGEVRLDGKFGVALTGIGGSWGQPVAAVAPPPSGRQPARRGRQAAPAVQASPVSAAGGTLAASEFKIDFSRLAVRSGSGGVTAQIAGNASVSAVNATVPAGAGAAPFDVRLARLGLGFDDLAVAAGNGQTTAKGDLQTSLENLSATQPATGQETGRTALSLASLRVRLDPLEVKSAGEQTGLTATGNVDLGTLSAELPKSPARPAATAGVAQLRANIDRIAVDSSPRGLGWEARIDAQASGLAEQSEGGSAASAKVKTLSVGGLVADSGQHLEIQRVVLERPEVFVTRDYLTGTAAKTESRPQEVARAVEEARREGWTVKIDSFGLTGGGLVRVRDTSVQPTANFVTDISALQVSNLNTGDPAQKMQMRIEATINEFTELAVAGWAAPFGKQPDFDVNARLRRLELPPLSPYAAQAVGVNVESGRLSVEASAAASAGKLQGDVEVSLYDLGFSTPSAEQAQRLSASVGVPIETVVGLLQDDEGRIRLKLPVSGDLANPTFGLGDAIQQAVTGAVQAAVLAPFQLAFAPVALIAKAAGGSMKFEPIPFDPGSAELNSTGKDMAAGLARVFAEREKLKLRVCGRATAADLNALLADEGAPAGGAERGRLMKELQSKLEALAGQRTAAVRRSVIEQSGVKPYQVGECRNTYDPQDTGAPRVDITL